MKKVIFIGLLSILLVGCNLFAPKTIEKSIINNSSVNVEVLIPGYYEDDGIISTKIITISPGEKINFKFYDNQVKYGKARLAKITRVTMSYDDGLYTIQDAIPVKYTIFNMTTQNAIVSEINNLFDTTTVASDSTVEIDVYLPDKINVYAVTAVHQIKLNTEIQRVGGKRYIVVK